MIITVIRPDGTIEITNEAKYETIQFMFSNDEERKEFLISITKEFINNEG